MTDAYGGIGGSAISELAISETGGGAPSLLDTLRAGDFAVVVVQEMRTAGAALVYRMYLSDRVWTTLPTDAVPSMTLGGEITGGPVINGTFSFGRGAQNNGEQAGSVDLIVHADGVPVETVGQGVSYQGLTRIRREKLVGGWPTKIMIGYPEYGLDSFHTVWVGVGADLSVDGATKARLTFRDNRAALSRGVLSPFAGTGGAEGTAEMAGKLKPRHYGAPKNVTPVLIDATLNIYCVSDRAATVALPAAYDGAKALTVDSTSLTTYAALAAHAVASGSWAQARVTGVGTFIRLGAAPTKRLTVDFADVLTVPAIIRAVLETAGLASSSVLIETEGYPFGSGTDHSQQWQTVQDMIQNDAAGYLYIADQATPNDLVDGLCKGIGWSRYLDDFGRENFTAPDYVLHPSAVAGTDYTILSAGNAATVVNPDGSSYVTLDGGDILALTELDLPSTMWPPNGRERLLAKRNHAGAFTETDVLAGAADAMRQYVLKVGNETTVESPADIFAALKDAVDPEALDTHFVDESYLPTLGDWLLKTSALSDGRGAQKLYLTKRQIFEVTLPMEWFATLPTMRMVKFQHPTFYADGQISVTGQVAPVETDWKARTRKYYAYAQSQKYSAVFAAMFDGPNPGASLAKASGMAKSGDYVFVACQGRNNLAVIDVLDPTSPAWVAEAVGTDPGPGQDGASYVSISGSYAFVTCPFRNSLLVADISDPTAPTLVTEFFGPDPATNMVDPRGIAISGNYAFVAGSGSHSISVIDISTPSSPIWVTEFSGPAPGTSLSFAWGLATNGSNLFVTCYADDGGYAPAMAIIDISDPTAPAWVSKVAGQEGHSMYNGQALSVSVSGGVAYLADYYGGKLVAIDISDPANPKVTAEVSSPAIVATGDGPTSSTTSASSVTLSRGYAYMASDVAASVSVFDLSNPLYPAWVSETGLDAVARTFGKASILPVGDCLYVASPTRNAVLVIA